MSFCFQQNGGTAANGGSRVFRLSGQSNESGVSGVRGGAGSCHSGGSGSSQGSLDHLEESGYSSTVNVHEMLEQGLAVSSFSRISSESK